jgi:hypothetical protein
VRRERHPSNQYVLVRMPPAGARHIHRFGTPKPPTGSYPIATSAETPASTASSGTTMSMSMIGFAAKPGTDVLPTCSMLTMGTPSRAIS